MYILGEKIYFWSLKKLIQDLRTKQLTDRAQLYYLCLIILISPIVSLISNLDELWGIEWYFALSWVAKFCAILGLFACYCTYGSRTAKATQDTSIRPCYAGHSPPFVGAQDKLHGSIRPCYAGHSPRTCLGNCSEIERDVPNNFLSCLISISWVVGLRILLLFLTIVGLLVLFNNFNWQWFNCDYLVWCLNSWVGTPYELIFGILILNLIFFGLVSRAIARVIK